MTDPGKQAVAGLRRRMMLATIGWLAAAALFGGAAVPLAATGAYPEKPIHIIVPFAAGTQLDLAARIVGAKLADAVGQPVVIENRPGASGNIGSEMVAKSAPDGYTLLMTGSLITLLPSTVGPGAVDPVQSFAPVSKVAKVPLVILVHPSLGVNTLPELVQLARRQPGRVAYATPGVGTTAHLAAVILAREAGIDLLHIPYVDTGIALREVLTGEPPVYFAFRGPIDPYVGSGQLKALAVAGSKRMLAWPDVPTVVELGYANAAIDPWNGVLAPARTPPAIIERLYREFARIMQEPDVGRQFAQVGMEPLATTPEAFAAEIRESVARWPAFVSAMGIRVQ